MNNSRQSGRSLRPHYSGKIYCGISAMLERSSVCAPYAALLQRGAVQGVTTRAPGQLSSMTYVQQLVQSSELSIDAQNSHQKCGLVGTYASH
jgi:hypothetical protein